MTMKMDGEINPNHPTTKMVSEQWHAFMALAMFKLGHTHLVFTEQDVTDFAASPFKAVVVKDGHNGDGCMHFWLVDAAEAERLAREEGGLPV